MIASFSERPGNAMGRSVICKTLFEGIVLLSRSAQLPSFLRLGSPTAGVNALTAISTRPTPPVCRLTRHARFDRTLGIKREDAS
jgi:hypothetical protein